jgi:hypothetical protein
MDGPLLLHCVKTTSVLINIFLAFSYYFEGSRIVGCKI